MSAPTDPSPSPAAPWLARGITATWWYTASSVVFIHLTVVVTWGFVAAAISPAWPPFVTVLLYGMGAVLSLAGAVVLLGAYRRGARTNEGDRVWPTNPLRIFAYAATLLGAVLLGVATGSPLLGGSLVVYALCLIRWPAGVRLRLVILAVVALGVLWAVAGDGMGPALLGELIFLRAFAVSLGPLTAVSLWWWDIVVELDRARAAESRLAAVQERLRLAGDLHDLQGHHLQVIALQLELADRMLPGHPDAAAEQVRLARASVDDARRGTRELAGRFRGVPLPDELANAADLLRAAGIEVSVEIAPDAASAPVDVLGPVIRECTTNVLKHGGGAWTRLELRHVDGVWCLRVANDPGEASPLGSGAGLTGIAERVRAVGGTFASHTDDEGFEVVVTVPAVRVEELR